MNLFLKFWNWKICLFEFSWSFAFQNMKNMPLHKTKKRLKVILKGSSKKEKSKKHSIPLE